MMSSNPPNTGTATNATWVPTTEHRLGLWTVRRGPDGQWHFPGQRPDERVRMVVRKHKWFLVRPALPLIGSLALFFLSLAAAGSDLSGLQALWSMVEIVAGIFIILTGINFLYKDLVVWFYETAIITDKRIIQWGSRGSVLNPSRQETPLDKVMQVAVDQHRLWAILLDYGTVHIYLVGGEMALPNVPRPKIVKEAVRGIHEQFQAQKPPKEDISLPRDPVMYAALEKLAKPDEVAKLPNADEKYTSRHPERYRDKVRGPRRTFGGPLRISCNVHYTSDEFTVEYIQRSPYVLAWRLVLPILVFLATIVITALDPSILMVMSILALILLPVGALIVINYVDDVYILTNKRIIDIQRKLIIFAEDHIETEYKNIRDIKVNVPNVFEYALNIGDVYVETPGNSPNIILNGVSHPFAIQDKIYFIKDLKDKADKTKAKNERKEELLEWFSVVTSRIEQKAQHKTIPDLRMLDFLTAAERAYSFGLEIDVLGEDSSYTYLAPGTVVMQNPLPGTLMDDQMVGEHGHKQPLEIHVVLSR